MLSAEGRGPSADSPWLDHSPTRAPGTACERTAWHATQRAAWQGAMTDQRSRLEQAGHDPDAR